MKTIYDSESEFVIEDIRIITFIYCVVILLQRYTSNLKEPKWVERDRNIKLLLK
jgi:hypothetical protein